MSWVSLLAIGLFSLPGFRKENGNYYNILGLCRGSIGIMEKKMETTLRTLFTNGFRGLHRPTKCGTESKQITLCRVI